MTITDPIDGKENENSGSEKGTADFFYEEIVPVCRVLVSDSFLIRWFSSIEVEFVLQIDPNNLKGVEND